jgi:hypothetical protein
VKINEIVNEGVISSFAKGLAQGIGKGLMPDTLRKIYPDLKKPGQDIDPVQLAHDTYGKYGHNPESPWTDPRTGKPLLPDKYGYFSWLTPYDFYQEKDKIVGSMSDSEKEALPDDIKRMLNIVVPTAPTPAPGPVPTPGPTPSTPPGPIPPGFEWDGSKFVPIKRKK